MSDTMVDEACKEFSEICPETPRELIILKREITFFEMADIDEQNKARLYDYKIYIYHLRH